MHHVCHLIWLLYCCFILGEKQIEISISLFQLKRQMAVVLRDQTVCPLCLGPGGGGGGTSTSFVRGCVATGLEN